MTKKILKFLSLAVALILILAIALSTYFYLKFTPAKDPDWGISFSQTHAQYLGFDWKVMYLDILNDLKPKKIRLMAYWENLEREPNLWYFQDVDEMLLEAEKRNIEVVLSIGVKLPRWPECHYPAWFKSLPADEQKERQLNMVYMAVDHFRKFESIKIWQIENEPLFNFGPECPKIDKEMLKQEMELVRKLDSRPIMLTDSGELGRWVPTARLGPDIFGSTMYRVVHHKKFGYFSYPLPSAFFRIKAGITQTLSNIKVIKGVELQAEPWFDGEVFTTDLNTQFALMNPTILQGNVEYARRAGLDDNYLWGVEWWYWLARSQNDWGMWEAGKNILSL